MKKMSNEVAFVLVVDSFVVQKIRFPLKYEQLHLSRNS